MTLEEKMKLAMEFKARVMEYLQDQIEVSTDALKSYDEDGPIKEQDPDIRKMRETEIIKLRQEIAVTTRHLAVIRKMK